MKRLAIITTHPIQYNAPLFRLLSQRKRIGVKVFYTWGQSNEAVYDARFGMNRSWDIPLLDGYEAVFVPNVSAKPDSNRFRGVINPGLLQQLKKEQFDAVLVYRWSVWSHFKLMQCLGSKPVLFFRGDSHFFRTDAGIKFFLRKQLLRFVYRKVRRAFVVGTYNQQYMQTCGLQTDQLIMAPHAVDLSRFTADAELHEQQALAERQLLGIPNDAIVFLYAGKFYALKELDVLVNAFLRLKGSHYRLLLVGQGEMESRLRQLAANDERMLFLPFRNQSAMPMLYRMGDVFVLPSKSETWGLSINEAMACSRPAVVSDACGCAPDLIVNSSNGFVFRSGDAEDLFRIMSAGHSKEDWAEMGRQAFTYIQGFGLEQVADAIEQEVLKL